MGGQWHTALTKYRYDNAVYLGILSKETEAETTADDPTWTPPFQISWIHSIHPPQHPSCCRLEECGPTGRSFLGGIVGERPPDFVLRRLTLSFLGPCCVRLPTAVLLVAAHRLCLD